MKGIKTTVLLAVIIALPIIAYMHPLNSAAIAIIFAIASVVSGFILAVVTFIAKRISSSISNKKIAIVTGVLSALVVFSLFNLSLYRNAVYLESASQNEAPKLPRDSSPIPSREFLYSNEEPNKRYGAYGYVLFLARPNKETYKRYEKVCENYLGHLEHLQEYEHIYSRRLMVTYWLLSGKLPEGASLDCAALIQYYDYARAKEIASAVSALSFNGPVFVAWKYPYQYSDGRYADHALTFDISRFSNEDISRATKIWLSIIVEPEGGLRHGTVILAEEFRNLLQRYGEDILDFVKKKA